MSIQYYGSHSILFGKLATETLDSMSYTYISGKDTWKDWHLVPASRPVVSPPSPNTRSVTVPGMNGAMDFGTLLTGYMTYQNRTGSWEFLIDNIYWPSMEGACSTIMAFLHGESLVCSLTDDPGYYYKGNFRVSSIKSDKSWSKISIDYDLYPYKLKIQSSSEPWLWDPFNFDSGITNDTSTVNEYGQLIGTWNDVTVDANSSKTLVVRASEEVVMPDIYCSQASGVTLAVQGKTFNLGLGTKAYRGLKLKENTDGSKDIVFVFTNTASSQARVGVIFRGGEF